MVRIGAGCHVLWPAVSPSGSHAAPDTSSRMVYMFPVRQRIASPTACPVAVVMTLAGGDTPSPGPGRKRPGPRRSAPWALRTSVPARAAPGASARSGVRNARPAFPARSAVANVRNHPREASAGPALPPSRPVGKSSWAARWCLLVAEQDANGSRQPSKARTSGSLGFSHSIRARRRAVTARLPGYTRLTGRGQRERPPGHCPLTGRSPAMPFRDPGYPVIQAGLTLRQADQRHVRRAQAPVLRIGLGHIHEHVGSFQAESFLEQSRQRCKEGVFLGDGPR